MNQRTGTTRLPRVPVRIVALLLGGVLLSVPAGADTVKVGGFWLPDLVVTGIQDGRLTWSNSQGTEFVRPLGQIEGLGLDAIPELHEAHQAMDKSDWATAVTKLTAARAKARERWVRMWIDGQLAQVYDKQGQALPAVSKFIEMAQGGADRFFLERPPLASVSAATEEQKRDIKARLEQALGGQTGDATESLKKLLALAGGGTVEQQARAQAAATAATARAGDDLPAQPAYPMPRRIEAEKNDPIVRKLWLGQYAEALELADKELATPTRRLSTVLYFKGVAQLGLADASGEEKRYKDAGLSLARVVFHFPKSPWVGASLVELGYVHEKLNRPQIARRMFDQARNLIDPDADPAYAGRLDKLVETLAEIEAGK